MAGKREKKGARKVQVPPTAGDLGRKVETVQMHEFLPERSIGPVRFEVEFAPTGGEDRLPVDSKRHLSLLVKPPVRFLPVRTHRGALDILRDVDVLEVVKVADPVDPVALSTASLKDVHAIVIADADLHGLEEAGLKNLERFVRRGGGLLAYLGTNAFPKLVNEKFFKERGRGLFPMLLEEGPMYDTSENPVLIDHKAAGQSPLFEEAGFAGSPEFLRYRRVKDCPEEKIVARYGDGAPAVIEHKYGRGRVLIVTTTPDERAFRLNGSLLPVVFLFNAAHYLVADDPGARNVLVGQPVRLILPAGARQVVVEPPEQTGGRTEEPVADPDEPFVWTDTTHAGFYRLTVKGVATAGASSLPTEETHYAAVNIDTVESDLRRFDRDRLRNLYQGARLHLTDDPEEILPRAVASDDKGELSRGLLTAVVVMLFVELLLAWRFGSRRRPT
jgi:hypothetical protein